MRLTREQTDIAATHELVTLVRAHPGITTSKLCHLMRSQWGLMRAMKFHGRPLSNTQIITRLLRQAGLVERLKSRGTAWARLTWRVPADDDSSRNAESSIVIGIK